LLLMSNKHHYLISCNINDEHINGKMKQMWHWVGPIWNIRIASWIREINRVLNREPTTAHNTLLLLGRNVGY
jgi:hypothetical protein